jgi:hypothetical protein
MNVQRQIHFAAALVLLLVATIGFFPTTASAQSDAKAKPEITVAQLAGPWQVAVNGNTGCGQTSLLFTGTLSNTGVANGTLIGNSGCGPSNNAQTFEIITLNSNGSGTAGLSCGSDCGWIFNIQVAPNKQVMNLVDVTDGDGNYLGGTAIKQ